MFVCAILSGMLSSMTITPRMVVLALIAAATLLVLSLAALGANFAAQQAVAMRDKSTATSSPHPTGSSTSAPVLDVATDDEIAEVFISRFESARLLSGGTSPIVFITVPSQDPVAVSSAVNDAISSLIVTGDFSEITLLLEYDGKIFDAAEVSNLVDRSTSVENQLIIELD